MNELVADGYLTDGIGNIKLLSFDQQNGEMVEIPFTQSAYDELLQKIADQEAAALAQTPPSA